VPYGDEAAAIRKSFSDVLGDDSGAIHPGLAQTLGQL
jgi:hypothetical protein